MNIDRDERPKMVTIKQAQERAGVSRRTIYNWMDSGKIQFVRTAGGHRRIFEDTLWRDSDGRPAGRPEYVDALH